jgi:hypothetical protein
VPGAPTPDSGAARTRLSTPAASARPPAASRTVLRRGLRCRPRRAGAPAPGASGGSAVLGGATGRAPGRDAVVRAPVPVVGSFGGFAAAYAVTVRAVGCGAGAPSPAALLATGFSAAGFLSDAVRGASGRASVPASAFRPAAFLLAGFLFDVVRGAPGRDSPPTAPDAPAVPVRVSVREAPEGALVDDGFTGASCFPGASLRDAPALVPVPVADFAPPALPPAALPDPVRLFVTAIPPRIPLRRAPPECAVAERTLCVLVCDRMGVGRNVTRTGNSGQHFPRQGSAAMIGETELTRVNRRVS